MNIILEKIASYNNLYWAYQKAKNIYKPGDIWFDELEVAAFEADLGNQLKLIGKELLEGTYQLHPIKPVAFPKSNENGPRTRQTFAFSVRDQVVWLAVTNIIGRYLDSKMPSWSYGNRLYISMFYSPEEEGGRLQFGYYRNTTRYTFRKWSQSWPLYRRHINLTTKFMTKTRRKDILDDLDAQERKVLENNENLVKHPLKSDYLDLAYWKRKQKKELYWAGLDLEKFYPNLDLQVLKENLFNYLPEIYRSEELSQIISQLLDFKLDCEGWSDEELEQIQLKRLDSYAHLPTGLFVAGFLANVALMEVDKKVNALLKENRTIAHFRYVDDHLILSTDLDRMLDWIATYEKIIVESGTGAKFNSSKTEPPELGFYFAAVESGDKAQSEIAKQEAKKKMSLDPDFPSPLMTKTLGKVSKIAGTPFNLLSPEEEKNMVADVEHLLVTDFPDHELRKDTRISFAARMLSSIVPKISVDSSEAYRLQRNICLKEIAIAELEKKREKASRTIKRELSVELRTLKTDLKNYNQDLKREEKRLAEEEEVLSSKTIKLLLKAITENHEKVRLWSRLLEFFLRSGQGKLSIVLSELKKLVHTGETNTLSLTFLNALVLQVLGNLVLHALRTIMDLGNSDKKRARARVFLIKFFHRELFNGLTEYRSNFTKGYEIQSYQLFIFSASAVYHILRTNYSREFVGLNKDLCRRLNLIDFNNELDLFIQQSNFPAGVWAWWFYSKVPVKLGEKPPLWNEMNIMLGKDYEIDINVLQLYPRHLGKNLLENLDAFSLNKLSQNEALWYEIYRNQSKDEVWVNTMFSSIAKKRIVKPTIISIDDWIAWGAEQRKSNNVIGLGKMRFDPRLGEWMALELVRQIAEEIKEHMESYLNYGSENTEYFRYLHSHNFKLPRKWISDYSDLTWEKLRSIVGSSKVSLRAREDLIMDERFVPMFGLEQDNENQSILHGLGSILISLLSFNSETPNKWNPLGQQPAWMGLAKIKLKDIAISSYTRDIISGCYSNRNIETRFNLGLEPPEFLVSNDTYNDPPDFASVDDFINHVKVALRNLEKQQLSVSSHQPRQLTPISIIQLKRDYYQNLIDQEEVE